MSVKSVAKHNERELGLNTRTIAAEMEEKYPYEEFARAAVSHLLKYDAAMSEMKVRFEIIDKDLQVRSSRNPIHHIESRLKSASSMYEKIIRYGYEPTMENVEKYMMDIAGIRIITSYIEDVYRMVDLLKSQDDLAIIEVKDYIARPKPNGYRSLHVIVCIPVYFMDSKQMIPVEVQIRTIAMDFWASLEHDLKYKAIGNVQGVDSYDELKECSSIIEDVERRMQVLASALDEKVAIEPMGDVCMLHCPVV